MAELKTKKTDKDVSRFIKSVDDEQKQEDAFKVLSMMQEATGDEPKMWGSSIIGFGDTTYTTADGKEHQWFKIGFSPRKTKLSLYILNYSKDEDNEEQELLDELGKYKRGKSCLYIKRLSDIDESVLQKLIERAC